MECVILKATRILYGPELKVINDAAIVIENDKIKSVISQKDLESIENIEKIKIIDAGNCTIMPGMIDCHSHLNIDANLPEHLELLAWSNECELTLISLKGLSDDLQAGITTLRCLGDKFYIDVTLKEKIQKEKIEGPDILSSGIGIKGLHGSGYIGMPHCGLEAVRETVRENLKRKVDTLKLFITPGQPPQDTDFIPSFLSYEEIKEAVSEGKRLNIPVAAHCIGGEGLKNCINAGVEVIEHAYAVTDEDVELLKQSDCWIDLTSGIFMDPSREEFLSEENVRKTQLSRKKVTECLKKIVKAKIPFVLGTDAYHGKLWREAKFALELGADIKDVLKGLTSNAAKVCHKENSIGSIKEGYIANIIAIKGNPYEDISALSNVDLVVKRGKILKNTLS